jgi:hypothetical protein
MLPRTEAQVRAVFAELSRHVDNLPHPESSYWMDTTTHTYGFTAADLTVAVFVGAAVGCPALEGLGWSVLNESTNDVLPPLLVQLQAGCASHLRPASTRRSGRSCHTKGRPPERQSLLAEEPAALETGSLVLGCCGRPGGCHWHVTAWWIRSSILPHPSRRLAVVVLVREGVLLLFCSPTCGVNSMVVEAAALFLDAA